LSAVTTQGAVLMYQFCSNNSPRCLDPSCAIQMPAKLVYSTEDVAVMVATADDTVFRLSSIGDNQSYFRSIKRQ
jgi:hypothetical protein